MNGSRLRVPVSAEDQAAGPADAPVTLLEYGDFECPHCGMAYPSVERVRKAMRRRLRFVFRNFPMPEQHPHAVDAAAAALAAGRQGRFWEMHHLLFTHQRHLDLDSLFAYAAGLRMDMVRFEGDFRSRDVARRIDADIESGLRSGVNGTPTFFLNGFRYDGDWSGRAFLEAVREAAMAPAG